LFASLKVDADSLLENQAAIFRYLRIRQKIATASGHLPFLNLPTGRIKTDKALINQRESQGLGFYLSYFSR
jgi:hypothetical protein